MQILHLRHLLNPTPLPLLLPLQLRGFVEEHMDEADKLTRQKQLDDAEMKKQQQVEDLRKKQEEREKAKEKEEQGKKKGEGDGKSKEGAGGGKNENGSGKAEEDDDEDEEEDEEALDARFAVPEGIRMFKGDEKDRKAVLAHRELVREAEERMSR